MGQRVVIQYKAAAEWDGRVMDLVVEDAGADWADHYREFWTDWRHVIRPGATLWVERASYAGGAEREWYLRADQVVGVQVEAVAEAAPAEVVQGDLFAVDEAADEEVDVA